MSKFIISCVGMPKEQCDELAKELNDPNSDKSFWVVDKPCTIVEAIEEEE